jgi:hypothetical protein
MGLADDLIEGFIKLVADNDQLAYQRDQAEDFNTQQIAEDNGYEDWDAVPREEKTELVFGQEAGDGPAFEPVENIFGGTFNSFEDAILDELEGEDLTDLTEIEDNINDAEGVAIGEALGVISGTLAIELLGGTQMESHQMELSQIMSFLALEDLLGIRSQVVAEQAVLPSLEAQVGKQNRTQFVDLPDAVEYALRNKESDTGWLQASTAPQDTVDTIGSNNQLSQENLLEEWGVRDDQLEILERVSLNAPEFEEILETPLQLGVPPTEEAIDEAIQLSGLPDSIAELFREAAANAEQSADMWEQKTVTDELVGEYDTLARDGEISPGDAVADMPEQVDPALASLENRWNLLADVPRGSPTRSMMEGSFASGYTDLETLRDRLERLEYDVGSYEDVLKKQVLDELDGDLQQAVALGQLSEAQYTDYAEFAGLDDETVELLLQGQSLSDIKTSRLAEQADPSSRTVGTLVGIGESRARALAGVGIETVADLAGADVETVAETAQVSPETAQQFIDQAQQRIQ